MGGLESGDLLRRALGHVDHLVALLRRRDRVDEHAGAVERDLIGEGGAVDDVVVLAAVEIDQAELGLSPMQAVVGFGVAHQVAGTIAVLGGELVPEFELAEVEQERRVAHHEFPRLIAVDDDAELRGGLGFDADVAGGLLGDGSDGGEARFVAAVARGFGTVGEDVLGLAGVDVAVIDKQVRPGRELVDVGVVAVEDEAVEPAGRIARGLRLRAGAARQCEQKQEK